jgi:hypothetical protein
MLDERLNLAGNGRLRAVGAAAKVFPMPVEIGRGRATYVRHATKRPSNQRETTMQYLLMIYGNEARMAAAPTEAVTQMSAAYVAYTEALKKAGAYVGGERLKPVQTATTVRIAEGKTKVLDGPYADTKEQLGGYYVIEAADMDAAISWAARCPGASTGTMEVRPIWPMTM